MTFVIDLVSPDAEPRVIGDLMIHVEDAWAQAEVLDAAKNVQAELGWALDPAYSRQGYAFEAVRAVIDFCNLAAELGDPLVIPAAETV